MIKFRTQNLSIISIASLLTALIVALLLLASSMTLHSSYKFQGALAERSEEIIVSNLKNGALPFAVATNDISLIRSIIDSYIKHREVYSVQISAHDSTVIHRAVESEENDLIRIHSSSFDIVSPYHSFELDDFETSSPSTKHQVLGKVTIAFSTEERDAAILNQVAVTGGMLLLAITLIVTVLLIFNNLISKYLSRMIKTMAAIEKQEIISWEQQSAPKVYEFRVMYDSFKKLYQTINDREKRLKESLQQALEARYFAQRAEQFKDEFVSAISHDIRKPVGVVVNMLELINDDLDKHNINDLLKNKLSACFQSARILCDVTEELFNLEQFQNMELMENKEKILIEQFISRFKSLYKNRAADKGLGLSFKCLDTPHNSSYVFIDLKKLTLILENILDNAIKFTKSGWISLEWVTHDNVLTVTIKDSGIGIPEDQLNLIFDKHHQHLSPITSDHDGRGLGLYYVSKLLEVLNGTITVFSKEGFGSAFTLNIPYDKDDEGTPTPFANQTPINYDINVIQKPVSQNYRLKALVIDDDENTCFTLSEMLARHGVECETENIPEIGYRKLIKEKPDLVFIDYHMEGLSGDRLARNAMSIISQTTTFFVCITADAHPDSMRLLNNIFQEVYSKPFKSERLKSIIDNVKKSKDITDSIISTMKHL